MSNFKGTCPHSNGRPHELYSVLQFLGLTVKRKCKFCAMVRWF